MAADALRDEAINYKEGVQIELRSRDTHKTCNDGENINKAETVA